ncbi:ABC transporter permease [Neorhizobium galegae]|uniref:ABC transporter permease n=1 Tax=Neorhizobium galegae TaxID=399 RepID=UPI002106E7F7|nr:ABC transporter permease [Neorhizobium galegae]MCQ1810716.1 ABC transporter permease [Neorhizobium galegae]
MTSIDSSTSQSISRSSKGDRNIPSPRRYSWRLVSSLALPFSFLVLLAAGWEAMARRLANPLVPGVQEVFAELVDILTSGVFFSHMVITLGRVALGFLLAFIVSLALGILMGRNRYARQFFEPAILIGLTVPGLVWALLCVIWFGISLTTSTLAVALSLSPPLALSIAQGIKTVNADLQEITAVYRLSTWSRMRFLFLPTLIPFLLNGVRIGLSMGWKVIVLVEIFGLSSGVGYRLNAEYSAMNVAGVLAWTIGFAGVMAILEYGVIGGLERYLTRWRRVATV